jgi:hypothetical protein
MDDTMESSDPPLPTPPSALETTEPLASSCLLTDDSSESSPQQQQQQQMIQFLQLVGVNQPCDCSALIQLNLPNVGLSSLPDAMATMFPNLSTLFLPKNRFDELPAVLGKCKNLTVRFLFGVSVCVEGRGRGLLKKKKWRKNIGVSLPNAINVDFRWQCPLGGIFLNASSTQILNYFFLYFYLYFLLCLMDTISVFACPFFC